MKLENGLNRIDCNRRLRCGRIAAGYRFAATFALIVGASCGAKAEGTLAAMGNKAAWGGIDIVTSPIEIPAQVVKGWNRGAFGWNRGPFAKLCGTAVGCIRGLEHAAGRLGWGMTQLGGFWAAGHEDNWEVGLPLDAPFPWQRGVPYGVFEPTVMEGLRPVWRKARRGSIDLTCGVLEWPGQIAQGIEEGEPLAGILRGTWFFLSREWNGAAYTATFFLPNPQLTQGPVFESRYPWTALNDTCR